MPVELYASHLRVYCPLEAFPPEERAHWRGYLTEGPTRSARQLLERERSGALTALVRGRLPAPEREALVLEREGTAYLCPLRTQLRSWQAAVSFGEDLPAPTAELVRPRALLEEATGSLARWRGAHPDLQTHIATCTWTVPVTWFVLVEPDELQAGPGVRYLTRVSQARQRAAAALGVLSGRLPRAGSTEAVADTLRWLELFPRHAYLELDYGPLTDLMAPEVRAADHSVQDLAEALAGLVEADLTRAAQAYERLVERWRPLAQREHAS